jgi:pimeloyl-ACP methyl ester carboxylesterase
MQTVDVDGLTIAFEWRGEGSPLVLLHGGMIDHREWDRQLDGLSDDFTVVAWDTPGCGASPDPPETFRMGDYAECLAGLIGASRPRAAARPRAVLGIDARAGAVPAAA